MTQKVFANIILPVPLPRLFTYEIPFEYAESIDIGSRVIVPFGKKKIYSGVVYSIHDQEPEDYETKMISSVLDAKPIVNLNQLKFWNWISNYYMCTLGDVYKAALPSGLKLESKTKVHYNSNWQTEEALSDKENLVLNTIIQKKASSIQEINNETKLKNCLPIIKKLIDKEAVYVSETLNGGFKPKTKKILFLSEKYHKEQNIQNVFTELSKAKKQLEVLMTFFTLIGGANPNNFNKSVSKTDLKEKCNASNPIINELIKKGILIEEDEIVSRLSSGNNPQEIIKELTSAQLSAKNKIDSIFKEKDAILLHGVTSSGKTEIYIHLIKEQLAIGKKVLYLLPEIALTTQITSRLKKVFGHELGIYHSKYSDAERVEVYNDVLNNENYKVIIGVRSSIFLPFDNLGLIIIDEEHENTYKQFDPAPRYNARDAAIYLAHLHQAKTLLGTATPSIESYRNTQSGKFGLVELFERYKGVKLPEIITVNIREEYRKKRMQTQFSPVLMEHIKDALSKNEQVILFQNRRGFSPYVECNQCATVPKCDYCDVSMTYHKHTNQLVCHYCGYTYSLPKTCKACGAPGLQTKGFGTQKVEEDINIILPEAKVARMDLDTSKTRKSHETLIGRFEQGEVDILIGTQMISKGLDFNNVSVVGILNADGMLNYPDFRAYERSFQLMSQVGGRAGRKEKQGKVILQTSNPDNPVIIDVINNNFINHYNAQLEERNAFKYPPFYKLINLTVKHKNEKMVNQASDYLGEYLRGFLKERVVGPQAPPIAKIQNWYIRKIMLKIEAGVSLVKVKSMLQDAIIVLTSHPGFKSTIIQSDVDPM